MRLGKNQAAIGSLVFPLLLRSIPEILSGKFPVGYDTISAYVPLMLDWRIGVLNLTDMSGGWLLPTLLGFTQWFSFDPVLTMKVVGPLIYGFLGWTQFFFVRERLGWSKKKSLVTVILSCLYFTTLRLSWDLFRNIFALGFGLLALAYSNQLQSRKNGILFSLTTLLATASQALTGVVIIVVLLIDSWRTRPLAKLRIFWIAPGVLQLLASTLLFSLSNFEGVGVMGSLGTTRADAAFDFIPLILPCIFGLSVMRKQPLISWILLCGVAAVVGVFPGPQRWALLLTIPLTIAATHGLTVMLGQMARNIQVIRGLGIVSLSIWLMLGAAYLALPAQYAFPYFSHFTPTSMVQSSVPTSDSESVVESISWLSAYMPADAVLLTHHSMYGWAREYFQANNRIIDYGPTINLGEGLNLTSNAGYDHIYTIWWVNGLGWYGYSVPPAGLHLDRQFGNIGVFDYEPHSLKSTG